MDVLILGHADFVMEVSFKDKDGAQEFNRVYHLVKGRYKEDSFVAQYLFSDPNLLVEFSLKVPSENFPVRSDINKPCPPVLFENKEYKFSIEFVADIKRPYIYSKTKLFARAFDTKLFDTIYLLTAQLNLKNDIGDITFSINYIRGTIPKTVSFKFKVFSEKFDIKHVYPIIIREIELFYPRLVLDYLRKTSHCFDTVPDEYNDTVWWIIFGNNYKQLMQSLQFIIARPYLKLMVCKVLKKRRQIYNPTDSLIDKMNRFEGQADKYFIVNGQKPLEDNYENQVVKFILLDMINKFERLYPKAKEDPAGKRMTTDYKDELEFVYKALKFLSEHPFFQAISDINEIKRVSHVLTMKSGYADLYENWRKLSGGYKLFEGTLDLELKDTAYLYQIWCFLKMTALIKSLGAEVVEIIKVPEIIPNQFIIHPDKDMNSKIIFKLADGTVIELFHELLYNEKFDKDNAGTLTGAVRPDIVLKIKKNDLPDSPFLTYIFEVKYRLDKNMKQVHHYRDAIYSKEQYTDRLSKEIKGAYIIHPGEESTEWQESIDLIDVGTFALNPQQNMENSLLKKHLEKIIREGAIKLLKDVPPQKGKNYKPDNALVFVAFIEKEDAVLIHYMEETDASVFCNRSFLKAVGNYTLRYLAINKEGAGIKCIYEILSHQWISRREAYPPDHALFLDSGRKCLVLKLGNKKEFRERLQIKGVVSSSRYTTLENINHPINGYIKTISERETLLRNT